jgi:hypothetical protein
MGFRFRKSIKIAPGIKFNINKKSVGMTFGTRGAHYTVNSKDTRTKSVGIPGTGLSYVDVKHTKKSSTDNAQNSNSSKGKGFGCGCLILIGILIFVIYLILEY